MISEYNNNICNLMIDYIKSFTTRIEASSTDKYTINIDKYAVIDTNNFSINYLMMKGLTGTFTIKVYFSISKDGEFISSFDEDLEVPKMINNIFVIEGSMRIPTNTLDNDNTIAVYGQNVRINDSVNIEYQEDEHEPDGYKLTLKIYDDDEDLVLDGTEENFSTHQVNLSKSEIDKIKVKLDTDDVGPVLTRSIVVALANLGPDKLRDNFIDKKIYSPESNLMNYLNSIDLRKRISQSMKAKFYQYQHVYLRDIATAINRYFVVASEKNIDIPNTVNPLIFDTMKYKIVIPENVSFNHSMIDIIDVANTPINTNVNRINELNVCAEVKNDVVYIKCYSFNGFAPVEVAYTTYCTKKVILADSWDYNKNTFKEGITEVKYKLRLKLKTGKLTDTDYVYIEPRPDDKLSITTRRIPLGNMSDSVRVAMATSMEKQALELQDSQPSLVSAGNDDVDYEASTLLTRWNGDDSTIEKIDKGKIFIRNKKTNSIQFVEIPNPTPSANDSIISFEPAVKIGDSIVQDSILVRPHFHKDKAFELGTNVLAVYMNYLGLTHEDAIVLSETLAKKMTHYSIIDVHKPIYADDIVKYLRKPGSKVTSKDVLANIQTRIKVGQALRDTYTGNQGLLTGMGISYSQSNLTVPNNIDEGYVLNCKIFIDPDRPINSDVTKATIDELGKSLKESDYDFLPRKFKDLEANPVELGDKEAGYISYKLLQVNPVKIGDKLCNRYGSKGIVSLVLPDSLMPQIQKSDGTMIPTEIILNPAGVLHRKNISQLYECALCKCIYEIYNQSKKLISENKIPDIRVLLGKFSVVFGDRFNKMTDDQLVQYIKDNGLMSFRMNVGFYSKVSYQQLLDWMKSLAISEKDKIVCPDVTLAETKTGLKGFPYDHVSQPDESEVTRYQLGLLDQPCITGYEYMMKLFKQASYDGKVTSEIFDSDEPFMGKGRYRAEGQKIGEMELWILIGAGIEKFVQDQSESLVSSQYQFLNELLLSGYYIQDQQGSPLLSNERTRSKELNQLA